MVAAPASKPTYRRLLRDVFGFDEYRPGQEQVLKALHQHGAALAVFPTGGGKSLCYQLPGLLYDGVTVVVSPLIALMKDQIDFLRSRGVAAARLDSSLTLEEQQSVTASLSDGTLKLLYVAPERFNNERFRALMSRTHVSLFAVDEAHCISEWGHNFRPDYLKLTEYFREIKAERVLALTATATPPVVKDICAAFGIAEECAIVTGFYRANLQMLMTPTARREKEKKLLERLRARPLGSTIVYVTLQKTAEVVADQLCSAGFKAMAYHAGMEDDQRAAVQEWWMASSTGIVVATIAFGMGIDKSDVRYIYHYNLPSGLEAYSQEIGRAGRDGKDSIVELFACSADLPTVENFAYGDTPTEAAIRGVLSELPPPGSEYIVSQYDLSARHDIRPLVLKTLLTYLELLGVLKQGTPFYATYAVKLLRPEAEILQQFSGAPAELLRSIFAKSKKGTSKGAVKYSVTPDDVAASLKEERKRIVRALEVLEERGFVEISASEVRQKFQILQQSASTEELTKELFERFHKRETQAITGVGRVLKLAAHAGCQTNALAKYFGEVRHAPCGHCSFCINGAAAVLPSEPQPGPVENEFSADDLDDLRKSNPEALGSARQTARFLCGLSSPAATKARLGRNRLSGTCANRRFHDVLMWVQER